MRSMLINGQTIWWDVQLGYGWLSWLDLDFNCCCLAVWLFGAL
jgi:hypothetical protein